MGCCWFRLRRSAALVLAATAGLWLGPPPVAAQNTPPGQPARPAIACTLGHQRRLVLLALARCCAQDLRSNPSCRDYSRSGQFVIIKDHDRAKPRGYLIIPTAPLNGIESEKIFQPPFVDFWGYGWQAALRYVNAPTAETALAINSPHARTQDQLHIHLSCVLPAVAEALAGHDGQIGFDPKNPVRLALPPHQNVYAVVKVNALTGPDSPYRVAAAMPGVAGHMGDQSIAVVGSPTAGAYYVLDTGDHDPPRRLGELLPDAFGSNDLGTRRNR